MNVKEMLEEIPKRWPSATLISEWGRPPYEYFLVDLENKWMVGVGYGHIHYSNSRDLVQDLKSATTVEIGMFTPDGAWYRSEDMEDDVRGWQTSEQLFEIIDYISKKPTS